MKIALLGATGRTGGHVLKRLDPAKHQVRALYRSKPDGAREGVEWVEGDVKDAASIKSLVEGCDAVIAALASTNSDPVCSTATRHVIAAAEDGGPRRYIAVSGAGVDAPGDEKGLPDKIIGALMKVVVGGMLKDRQAELALVQSSSLLWTFARPPRLTDGKAKGEVKVALTSPQSTSITRADLATFLVDQLEDERFHGLAPFVSN